MGITERKVSDAGTDTGDAQVVGLPRAVAVDDRTETGDIQVGLVPRAVAELGTRVSL